MGHTGQLCVVSVGQPSPGTRVLSAPPASPSREDQAAADPGLTPLFDTIALSEQPFVEISAADLRIQASNHLPWWSRQTPRGDPIKSSRQVLVPLRDYTLVQPWK